jgi:hypothetical protein
MGLRGASFTQMYNVKNALDKIEVFEGKIGVRV